MIRFNENAKVGYWIVKRDSIYGNVSQGRITKIENGVAFYWNSDAFDGFGSEFETRLDDSCVEVRS